MKSRDDESGMTAIERELLRSEIGEQSPRLTLRTGTRIDTGRWWRSTPVWLCITDDQLVLLAGSKRRYSERIDLADCRESRYCPLTGQLVIEPIERPRFGRLRLSPSRALQALRLIQGEQSPSPETDRMVTENSHA